MKPFQIGLLVLVGALGGALIMKFVQRPKPVPAPAVAASTAPAPTPVSAEITAPEAPPATPKPSPLPDEAESAPPPPKRPVSPASHAKPVRQARPAVITVAQNLPPAQPQPSAAAPSPEPVQRPVAQEPPPQSAPLPVPTPASSVEPEETPAAQQAPSVTLQAGLLLPVRLGESLSSDHNQAGDTFTATLDSPLSAGGFVIAERGARVEGRVVEAQKSSHVKGQAALVLELTKLNTSDGQHVAIQTESFRKQAAKASGEDVGVVAAAAGVGAIIGAMAGGGKGAAIGAGAGGAAGTGGVMATRNRAVSLPTETKISFRLKESVTVTERLNR